MSVLTYPDQTTVLSSGLTLTYPPMLEGGGIDVRWDFLNIFKNLKRQHYKNALEWCAGHAIIGFELLGQGICENLYTTDILPASADVCQKNASLNNLQGRVTSYVSGTIEHLPEIPPIDLVVANPPHAFNLEKWTEQKLFAARITSTDQMPDWEQGVRVDVDDKMQAHTEFFTNIAERLSDDADIMIFETGIYWPIIDTVKGYGFRHVAIWGVNHHPGGGVILHFQKGSGV